MPQQIFFTRGEGALRCGVRARDRLRRAAGLVLVEPFLRLGRRRCMSMAGGYEREAIRPHVLGRFADMLLAVRGPSGDAVLSRQLALDRAEVGRRPRQHARAEREPRARDSRAAYARRALGLHAGRRHQLRQGADRLDHSSDWRPIRSTAASSCSIRACTSRGRRRSSARSMRSRTSSRAGRCSPISRAIRRPPRMWRASSRAISAADEPPDALVERLAKRFLDTDGDLKEIAKALVESPETWDEQRLKLKRPSEWLISAWRAHRRRAGRAARPAGAWAISASACGGRPRRKVSRTSRRPGSTGSRSGSTSRTASPSWCRRASSRPRSSRRRSGRSRRDETRQTIARAESRQQALTLALMAPEFQRR